MQITESSQVGQEVAAGGGALIIGVSINNSYFTEENIEKLLVWATAQSKSVYVMIPDDPAVFTLLALGRTQNEAEKVARLKSNALENKARKIIKRHYLEGIQIVRWDILKGKLKYLEAIAAVCHSYKDDMQMQKALRDTTASVLSGNLGRDATESEIDLGVQFLLHELAFICHSDLILKESKTAYVYHSTMQVMKDIMAGKYSFVPRKNVGFITAS